MGNSLVEELLNGLSLSSSTLKIVTRLDSDNKPRTRNKPKTSFVEEAWYQRLWLIVAWFLMFKTKPKSIHQ